MAPLFAATDIPAHTVAAVNIRLSQHDELQPWQDGQFGDLVYANTSSELR